MTPRAYTHTCVRKPDRTPTSFAFVLTRHGRLRDERVGVAADDVITSDAHFNSDRVYGLKVFAFFSLSCSPAPLSLYISYFPETVECKNGKSRKLFRHGSRDRHHRRQSRDRYSPGTTLVPPSLVNRFRPRRRAETFSESFSPKSTRFAAGDQSKYRL